MQNSLSTVNWFTFCGDLDPITFVNADEYLKALKMAAKKTINTFAVAAVRFLTDEFWELVNESKRVKSLSLQNNSILLNEEVDFGEMKGWNIERLGLAYSGGLACSNWKASPESFENLISLYF